PMMVRLVGKALHEPVRVDDTGERRPERRCRPDGRLLALELAAYCPAQPLHAIGHATLEDGLQRRPLVFPARYDELAGAPVGHAVGFAPGVNRVVAFVAMPRFYGDGVVVHPCVNLLAVPSARLLTEGLVPLEVHHRHAYARQAHGTGETDDAAADDDGVNAHGPN